MLDKIEIIYGAEANTDYSVGYLDGKPVVIDEYAEGYAHVDDGFRFRNLYDGFVYYVENGKWSAIHHSSIADYVDTLDCDSLDWEWGE